MVGKGEGRDVDALGIDLQYAYRLNLVEVLAGMGSGHSCDL